MVKEVRGVPNLGLLINVEAAKISLIQINMELERVQAWKKRTGHMLPWALVPVQAIKQDRVIV
jgi:hypothetical protein